jgi:benzoyl-CoA reductase/2-hydroxyglutaryl-CoA dehydratase subunit BcrC/BadD/HgdB
MKELLKLCGFEPKDIEKEMPRIRRTFDKLQINDKDIDFAKERLNKYFEIDLKGVRMMLKIYITEMVRLVLAKEENESLKVLYAALPSLTGDLVGAATLVKENVYGGFPEPMMLLTYGSIFHKFDRVWEAAENSGLVPETAHCGCNQAKLGMQLLNVIPRPDLLVSFGTYCDDAWKTDDFMQNYLGIPIVYVNRVQDTNWKEEIPERDVQYFADQLRKAAKKIGEVIGGEITDANMWQCLLENREYMQFVEKIVQLSINADPVTISANTMLMVFFLYAVNVNPENRALKLESIKTLFKEVQQKADRGQGFYQKGAPRIALASFPPIVGPDFDYCVRDLGLSVPVWEAQWWVPDAEIAPMVPVEELDPFRIQARTFLLSPLITPPAKRISTAVKAAKKWNLDGYLGIPHYSCRPFMADALMFKDAVKKATGLPATVLEADVYDYRHYTIEQQRTRLESFAEMCKFAKMKKMAKAA